MQRFIRFGLVGAIGFLVDTGVLYLVIYALGVDPYSGRLVSYFFAVTATWFLHRKFTFASKNPDLASEWARFAVFNGVGGLLNYVIYAVLVYSVTTVAEMPVLGVAAGSIAGLVANYSLSSRMVFSGSDG